MSPWKVTVDEDRPEWPLAPLTGVGPLRFGMTGEAVAAALGATPTASRYSHGRNGDALHTEDQFGTVGVTAYYDRDARLDGVAVDALSGPQVRVQELRLVARVPSELEREITECAERRGLTLRYTHEGNWTVPELGVVMRVQRAGDVVLTRPLLAIRAWAEDPWHSVSDEEWKVF